MNQTRPTGAVIIFGATAICAIAVTKFATTGIISPEWTIAGFLWILFFIDKGIPFLYSRLDGHHSHKDQSTVKLDEPTFVRWATFALVTIGNVTAVGALATWVWYFFRITNSNALGTEIETAGILWVPFLGTKLLVWAIHQLESERKRLR